MSTRRVYFFGETPENQPANSELCRKVLGGKGISLAAMIKLGMPVPLGFTITCQTCVEYQKTASWPEGLKEEVASNLKLLEEKMGKTFGDNTNPLLVSVRSGAAVSMPGMMDTILNLGLNDESVKGLAAVTGNARFAYDSYRRFMQMFGDVCLGIDHDKFEHALDAVKTRYGRKTDPELTADELEEVCEAYRKICVAATGKTFPQCPHEQLELAINAVFKSWTNPRAQAYRTLNKLDHNMGTAVNVQSMVFGNTGDDSGTGVGFTRCPKTGEKFSYLYGEFLQNAQGEDVVAGIRTPVNLKEMPTINASWKACYDELSLIYAKLEGYYNDMVDLEFTVENGKLWMLQARAGKRTGFAMVRIAIDMCKEGMLTEEEALLRIDANKINEFLFKRFDPSVKPVVLGKGIPASPGAAVGIICFCPMRTCELAEQGKKVILTRIETSPEDILGMDRAVGILTARGGQTSHAAVVARGMGKCCVAGADCCQINYATKTLVIGDRKFKEGDFISINGTTGEIYNGAVQTIEPGITDDLQTIMDWSDKYRVLKIRTNADTPHDAAVARKFGAEGIGLCRTEHMFFAADRIMAMREMILSDDEGARRTALNKLLPFQREDFIGIFKAMDGKGVNIRLLDPPLHEFLPHTRDLQKKLAEDMNKKHRHIHERVEDLHEVNPMLGFRGVRLGIVYPEISEMQVRAILEAACIVSREGVTVKPEIMIPVLFSENEMEIMHALVNRVAASVFKEHGTTVDYEVGTMIELPRACVMADKIAQTAQYFSFGTNDLTQTTFGISRDDAGKFIPKYIDRGIFKVDPFVTLDQQGVGALMKMAIEGGRSTRTDMKIGICGEQTDPASILFLHKIGLNYVSCSPYRVPVARVAAAIAAIKARTNQ